VSPEEHRPLWEPTRGSLGKAVSLPRPFISYSNWLLSVIDWVACLVCMSRLACMFRLMCMLITQALLTVC
jgi:hypothetical protein